MFKRGDMVMVVKPLACCGHKGGLGAVFEVALVRNDGVLRCEKCDAPHGIDAAFDAEGSACSVDRLRLIPPLSEPEAITTDEPLEVPA